MCGITGIFLHNSIQNSQLAETVSAMASSLEHRGPDDSGVWLDSKKQVAFGHRRLSIVDISSSGHQPMASASKRYVMTYNGEIYNHIQIRNELNNLDPNLSWKGHSDSETLLAAIEVWGLDKTLERIAGMFAIALWDNQTTTLHLIRDRFGEKPLYYGWIQTNAGKVFAFGSELKALKAYPGFKNSICRDALKQFFKFMYVPAPYSIFQGIYKLEPGSIISISKPSLHEPVQIPHCVDKDVEFDGCKISKWYKFKKIISESSKNYFEDEAEATLTLENQLKETIQIQSIADVPLGAFLSGGVDSSLIVALMQSQSNIPVKTFTIGFDESDFDESKFANDVAVHLNTDHYEMQVTSKDALELIPKIPNLYDEPFADSSQIPTFFVSQAAKKEVTVSLSGDAGDELFGGYNRYLWAPKLWKRVAWMPFQTRKALGSIMGKVPINFWDKIGSSYNFIQQKTRGVSRLGDKVSKTALRLSNVDSLDSLYKSLVCEWPNTNDLVKEDQLYTTNDSNLISLIEDPLPDYGLDDPLSRMMYWDTISYLPDDILCKVDRAAMGNSLETRVPFLDHRIAELAQKIPVHMKIQNGIGKSVLRNILYKYVPRELIERPKAGFGIPLGSWLRGPLRNWVEDLLNPHRLEKEGFLNAEIVNTIWREHLSGKRDWSFRVWSIVIFQQWLESQNLD